MLNGKNTTNVVIICLSIYLSFMTVRVSIEDHFGRSIFALIILSFLYHKLLKRYFDRFSLGLFNILHTSKNKVDILISSLKKSFLLPLVVMVICSITAMIIGGYLLTQADSSFNVTKDAEVSSKYRSQGEMILSKTPYALFVMLLSTPIIYFSILKFKERFSLKDSLFYSIFTILVIVIVLSLLVQLTIFLYYILSVIVLGEG